MSRIWKLALVIVLALGFYSLVLAQDKKDAMSDKDKMQGGMMGGGMGMMDKDKMMCKGCMMMGKAMVATSDGGVIVLAGNKLQKYDKDLMMIKEVDLKMDGECSKFMMQGKYHKDESMTGQEEMKKEEPTAGHKAQPGPY